MRRLSLFTFFLASYSLANGQNLITSDTVYKAGIYKNFKEFKYNRPSVDFNYQLKEEKVSCGTFGGEKVINYHIKIDRKKGKTIGHVFGLCDGKNVYISNSDTVKYIYYQDFSKLEYFGKYCFSQGAYFFKVKDIYFADFRGYLLDIDAERFNALEKKDLLSIISRDKELSNELDKQTKKREKLGEYFIKYLKKHKDENIL